MNQSLIPKGLVTKMVRGGRALFMLTDSGRELATRIVEVGHISHTHLGRINASGIELLLIR